MNYINIVFVIVFILSLFYTIKLSTIFFNSGRNLTEKGHKYLGITLTGLIISSLQLFNIFDFVKLIIL